LNTFRGLW